MNAQRKVLVVDDDPIVSKSFNRVLARKGYLVVSAGNGLEALSKVAHEDFDAVFTDIKMPGMSGIEVAERMQAKRPWTPVLIITGYGSAEHEARAEAAGVRGFLRKPLSPEMIESSLAAALAPAAPVADRLPQGAVAAVVAPEAAAVAAPQPATQGEASTGGVGRLLKNIALFVAAPFVGLAGIILFPIIGLALLAWTAGKAWRQRKVAAESEPSAVRSIARFVKNVTLFFAAPFVALAYIALFPIIGLGMLAWTGGQAWRQRNAAA